MADDGIELVELSERPELAEAVAKINFDQWADFTDLDMDEMRSLFRPTPGENGLPVTILAVRGDEIAGNVSLRKVTMGAVKHPEVYLDDVFPWLSNMWVADWARGKRLATRMSRAVEDKARQLGCNVLYSSTERDDSLYHKIGFRTVDQRPHHDTTVYLVVKELSNRRVRSRASGSQWR